MDMLNDFLERTLEDIIYNNRRSIHTRGLSKLKSNAFRQVILPSGRKIDILGFEINDGVLYCDIYELKREVINADAICQAFNYYTELKFITANFFTNIVAKIIMVGRRYEPVSIIDALPVPINVFTYEYYMEGIKFKEIEDRYSYSVPHESFSFGLWAFGRAGLSFNMDVSSVRFHSEYDSYFKKNPSIDKEIKGYIKSSTKSIHKEKEVELIEEDGKPKWESVKTIIFPEQPAWSVEFANEIPYSDNVVDELDGEIEDECEADDECEIDHDFEEDIIEDNYPSLINEKDYDLSLTINSLSVAGIISDTDYREFQSDYCNLFFTNTNPVTLKYPVGQEWLHSY